MKNSANRERRAHGMDQPDRAAERRGQRPQKEKRHGTYSALLAWALSGAAISGLPPSPIGVPVRTRALHDAH